MESNDVLKARAKAAFRKLSEPASSDADKETRVSVVRPTSPYRPVETTEGAMDEYKARQEAEPEIVNDAIPLCEGRSPRDATPP